MWAVLLGWIGINLIGFGGTGGSIAFEAHLAGLAWGVLLGSHLRRQLPSHTADERRLPDIDVRAWEDEYMQSSDQDEH